MRRLKLVLVCACAIFFGSLLVPSHMHHSDLYGVKSAVANPVDVIKGVQKSIKNVLKTGKKLAKKGATLAKTKVGKVAQSKLVKDLAQAKKDATQIKKHQKRIAKLKSELRKFKNAPKPPPINTIYSSAMSTLTSAQKTLKRAWNDNKKAIRLLSGAIKERAEAMKRFAASHKTRLIDQKGKKLLSQARSVLAKVKSKTSSKGQGILRKLNSAQRRVVSRIGKLIAAGKTKAAESELQKMIKGMPRKKAKSLNLTELVWAIMRESYLEQQKDFNATVGRVKKLNSKKDAVLAQAKAILGKANWKSGLKNLEKKLKGAAKDAQLANVDLQNLLNRLTQYMQVMSNVQKRTHDTAMAVIRRI